MPTEAAVAEKVPAVSDPSATAEIRHIVFDMDGVLLDSEPVYERVEGGLLSELAGRPVDFREILPKLLGRTSKDTARIVIDEYKLDMTVEAFLEERNARLMSAMANVATLSGVEAFVRAMRARGVRMSIATSSPGVLLDAKRFGKDDFFGLFEGIVCGDDVVNGKPDPEIFLKAARIIDAPPERCIVFEDAPSGIRGAKAAGMRCVGIPNPDVDMQLYRDAGPDFTMPGFDGIKPELYGLPPL